jgi:hypothetical protein
MASRRGLTSYLDRRRQERLEELKAYVRAQRKRQRDEAKRKKEQAS